MKLWRFVLLFLSVGVCAAQTPGADLGVVGDAPPDPRSIAAQPVDVQTVFQLTNQDRALQGLSELSWSPELAAAAAAHARLMAEAGTLSHRYPNEPDVATRASEAKAHFSRIAENIAQGPSARAIEKQWMTSVPHRANILDPKMSALGVAVIAAYGTLYAVEDFADAQPALAPGKIESRVRDELPSALGPRPPEEARRECSRTEGLGESSAARFVLRWEGADLALPQPLAEAANSGKYTAASVGACAPLESTQRAFTTYWVAVLLY